LKHYTLFNKPVINLPLFSQPKPLSSRQYPKSIEEKSHVCPFITLAPIHVEAHRKLSPLFLKSTC